MRLQKTKIALLLSMLLLVLLAQKVMEAVRKASREDWFEKLSDWFDIETGEGLHSY